MSDSIRHQDIVKRFLDSKAVDFAAVGKVFGELAGGVAQADEPGDFVCGVGIRFFHCFQPPVVATVGTVGELQNEG